MKERVILQGARSPLYVIWFMVVGVCLVGVASIQTSSPVYAQQTGGSAKSISQFGFDGAVPDEVKQAAHDGLEPFLQTIPVQEMELFGFPPGSGFEEISLGQPYRVFTIHPKTLLNSSGNEDIHSMVTPTQRWLFPILQRGEPRALLTVDLMDEEWRAVGIGSSRIAGELHSMERTWSDDKGYERAFVRIYQATSDVLLITKDSQINVLPFESARVSLNLGKLKEGAPELYSVSEIVHRLIPVVQENLNQNLK